MSAVTVRVRLDITGVVQGVGFRPAVARIAAEFGLSGWVYNDAGSVHCELEGPVGDVDAAVSWLDAGAAAVVFGLPAGNPPWTARA